MDRVGIIGENSVEYVKKIFDIWEEKKSVVLIDWRIPLDNSIKMLKKANVKKVFIEENLFKAQYSDFCIPYQVEKEKVMELPEELYERFVPNYSEEEAFVLFSSGTTGKEKGIKLSHRAINNNIDHISNCMEVNQNDTLFVFKTLAHSSSIIGELLVGIKKKCKVILAKSILPPRVILKCWEEYAVTYTFMNPTLLGIFMRIASNFSFPHLKAIYVYGAKAAPTMLENATKYFKGTEILSGYGLTEAGPRVTMQKKGENRNFYSAGKPIGNVEIIIVDEKGVKKAEGDKGWIHVKSDSEYSGYIDNTKKRKSYYLNWLNTGDIGYVDRENNLYIVGRSDNSCLVGAHIVYLEEIEEKVMSFKDIEDCLVVSEEDYIYGQSICCYYTGSLVDEKKLRDYLSKILASYEIPKKFIFTNELPLTLSGKKKRKNS